MTKRTILAGLAITALAVSAAFAQPPADAARCQSCHAASGPGAAPRLNGQRADYILARLREFHTPATQTAHATYFMWDIATSLGQVKARELADYFAAQPPTLAKAGGAPAMAGHDFYRVQGCAACHGADGEGSDKGPRLAGQHGLYLGQQLNAFSLSVRYHPAMFPRAAGMTADQMAALTAWLAGD